MNCLSKYETDLLYMCTIPRVQEHLLKVGHIFMYKSRYRIATCKYPSCFSTINKRYLLFKVDTKNGLYKSKLTWEDAEPAGKACAWVERI